MFAIVKTGGKQYTVAENDVIIVEKLAGEAGSEIKLEDVLLVGAEGKTTVGTPLVKGASVTAEVLEQGKGDKVIIFKKKRRQQYRRTKGHRQEQTVLRIKSIKG
ncbi:MAG: 50S ribosomal protein L21 [Methylocystaceae bacterium]|nr:50S ribosomal protein L21 [Methylocystaceae bacterium]